MFALSAPADAPARNSWIVAGDRRLLSPRLPSIWTRLARQVFLGAIVVLMSAVAWAQPDPDVAEGWVKIVPDPVTIDGKLYKPSCSAAPGTTTSTFSFFYRKGTADGLVVFFNGGGSCWNDLTCCKPRLEGDQANFAGRGVEDAAGVYKAELLPGDGPARMTGLLDRGNRQNPVHDWSMVFVPYCTGDVHSGSHTANYRFPDTGKPFQIEHRGWDNAQAVMHWMRGNVPAPARLLVAGSSAGAYGAATHYASLRALYPQARGVYLGDSGQGVTAPGFEAARNRNWNYQLPAAVFGPNGANTPDAQVVAKLAAYFPKDRFTQFTSVRDATQTAFLEQMTRKPDRNTWTTQMLSELAIREAAPNFRSYVASGKTHTILRAPLFFTEQSGGVAFTAWLAAQLSDDRQPDNARCPESKAP
ncbi:MAG: pectin acetylesterase-family hydrolase [Planctomycetaceae bacterium]